MIRINKIKLPVNHSFEELENKVSKILRVDKKRIIKIEIHKRSIDARKKPDLIYVYSVNAYVENEDKINPKTFNADVYKASKEKYEFKCMGEEKIDNSPVIIGMGPAGLFCAYLLALNGYKPIVLEQGQPVDKRHKDVEEFWKTGVLNPASNVQFGEGGAGTFSDGKLNTLVKDKFMRNQFVLETFHKFGASEKITYVNKPHIGTDILMKVVKNMREEIIRLGGRVEFLTKVTDFLIESGKLTGVVVNNRKVINTNVVVLAVGHSARDTFQTLLEKGFRMEQKNFAVGVRIEHPQEMIDRAMYGFNTKDTDSLMAADYKLTGHSKNGRNVFSFCMCPGGYVVNDPLSGVRFQEELEKKAYLECNGKVPVQLFGDYEKNIKSKQLGDVVPCIKGEYDFGNLNNIFPEAINEALKECINGFEKNIKNYNRYDAVMSGVESRTSSPVRILRDDEFESNIKGVYPCGEGAGYAGGITSAAMDGIKVFEAIAAKYRFF